VGNVGSLDNLVGHMESLMVHMFNLNSLDMCGDKFVIKTLEIAKSGLQQRVEKEVRDNSIFQANLERTKQILYKRHLKLEQDISSLQEQLQVELDLRASLEVQGEE